jgi:uncharacterized membrane protein
MTSILSDAVERNGRFLLGFTWIVGLVIAYVKRDELKGTLWEGHMTYAIRTAWQALGWGAGGMALFAVFILGVFPLVPILVLLGFPIIIMLGLLPFWFFARSLVGLIKALVKESVARPEALLF